MKLENRCLVPAATDRTWQLLMDIPQAAACVPGVQEITPEGDNRYRASMEVRVGPMRFNFSGIILLVEQHREKGQARFHVEAADRKVGGSLRADMVIELSPHSPGQTELSIVTDAVFMGKLGELGQPIIRRKAATTLENFAHNLSQKARASPNQQL